MNGKRVRVLSHPILGDLAGATGTIRDVWWTAELYDVQLDGEDDLTSFRWREVEVIDEG